MLLFVTFRFRYSPNYIPPLKTVAQCDDNEILDYTGSPHHCVATSRAVVNSSKWQDDSGQSQVDSHKFHAPHSPDPWAVNRQTQNINNRDHVYKVAFDFSEADSCEKPQVTTSQAGLTSCDDQSTTSTVTSSVTKSVTQYGSMG